MENQQPELQETQHNNLTSKINLKKAIEKFVFWVGLICATIALFAYILVVIVMVVGFIQEQRSLLQDTIFAVVTGLVGVIIMQFMKVQGIAFAKLEPNVKYWCEKWNTRRTKDRKYRSINFFWWTTAVKDIIFKLITIILLSVGLVYVFIEASNDPMRILFAVFNIVMFVGFGLHALSKAYTFYCTEHVEWIKIQLEDIVSKQENEKKEKAIAEDKLLVKNIHEIAVMLGTDYIRKENQLVDNLHQFVLQLYQQYTTAIDTVIPEETASTEPGKGA